MDFLKPRLESYLSETVRRTDITKLEAAPVLFHSGYLTLDKITLVEETAPDTGKKKLVKSFSFRLPNFEVSSSYYRECLAVLLGLKSGEEVKTKGEELREAFLSRNATAVQTIFSDILGTITYHQSPKGEDIFHSLVQAIIGGMGIVARPELPGPIGRLDLAVKLKDRVYGVIEFKYCSEKIQLKPDIGDRALAAMALERLPRKTLYASLATAIRPRLDAVDVMRITSATNSTKKIPKAEEDRLLAEAAKTSLPKMEFNKVLAEAFLKYFWEQIDKDLIKAAQNALDAIKKKDYHAVLKLEADEFIDLGMAVYGYGQSIKVVFDPPPNQA
jgi:hypothetical protein